MSAVVATSRAPSGRRRCAKLRLVSEPSIPRASRATPANGARVDALTTVDLVALSGGRLVRDSHRPILGAAVDSRLVRPGELFVALPGERTDGHRFLREAVIAGASAILIASELDPPTMTSFGDVTIVTVADPLIALQDIAAGWRARFDPLVVGVTGSIGKTSAKEAIATVLAARAKTLRSEGNQNNEIGLPLTLLRLGSDDRYGVLEMGMYTGGEIARLAAIAKPTIGVVTSVLGVHLSRIGSIEAVENAKAELIEALPANGIAVLNADDPRVRRMAGRTKARAITYGFARDADIRATNVRALGAKGMRFQLRISTGESPRALSVRLPMLGRLSVHNALAAAAVGVAVGMEPDQIAAALSRGWSVPHRVQLLRVGGSTIVDDSYNASPASMIAALELLAGLPGRQIAVLGEMLELGDEAEEGHRAVGRAAARTVALLITIGPGAAGIADGALAAGLDPAALIQATNRDAGLAALRDRMQPGDVVLVKASRGAELDRLVDALRSEPA